MKSTNSSELPSYRQSILLFPFCTLFFWGPIYIYMPLLAPYAKIVGGSLQAVNGVGVGLVFPLLMGLAIQPFPLAQQATAMGFFQSILCRGHESGAIDYGMDWGAPGACWRFYPKRVPLSGRFFFNLEKKRRSQSLFPYLKWFHGKSSG